MAKNCIDKAVILAGGSGERFWPLSTPERPKQFLRVFGGESLIRQSVNRILGLVATKDIFVVTSKELVSATRKELPELPAENIIGEPMRRDTGAAVALGVSAAKNGVVAFFPSDQMVGDTLGFRKVLMKAAQIAGKQPKIVTIGIKPTFPATGFGYIDPVTKRFVEKPDLKHAKTYLKKGFLWNAGIFLAQAETFRGAFAAFAPELKTLFDWPNINLSKVYTALPRISFDFAVMEKFRGIEVVPGDFGWDDVGSFAAFDKYFPHDTNSNVREGPCTVVDSSGNICVARSARISLLGVNNLVVITTPDAVLVADKSRISEMKKLFKK
ncbi:MAG: mannose-1-phosphate guanylyltransferase [Kiritimatiellae bacterium]|nr:mannose-1-phosphate guanylyltransferase [Kiritimatiellia bacterium]